MEHISHFEWEATESRTRKQSNFMQGYPQNDGNSASFVIFVLCSNLFWKVDLRKFRACQSFRPFSWWEGKLFIEPSNSDPLLNDGKKGKRPEQKLFIWFPSSKSISVGIRSAFPDRNLRELVEGTPTWNSNGQRLFFVGKLSWTKVSFFPLDIFWQKGEGRR